MSDHRAGPELDRTIAEKVMGWTHRASPEDNSYHTFYREHGTVVLHWSPSTNIAHAFEVVERMTSLGFEHLAINRSDETPEWLVWFGRNQRWTKPREEANEVEVEAEAVCMAICLAALKAVAP